MGQINMTNWYETFHMIFLSLHMRFLHMHMLNWNRFGWYRPKEDLSCIFILHRILPYHLTSFAYFWMASNCKETVGKLWVLYCRGEFWVEKWRNLTTTPFIFSTSSTTSCSGESMKAGWLLKPNEEGQSLGEQDGEGDEMCGVDASVNVNGK